MPAFPRDTTLHADGLILRLPADEDVPAIVAACQDPEIPHFTRVPANLTADHVRDFMTSGRAEADAGTALHMSVYDAADGRLVASCGLVTCDWVDLVGEVGYWVAADERGKGIATRAARAVCAFAFDDLGLQRMDLLAATTNPGSNGVARRLGFTLEGTRRRALVAGHTGNPDDPRYDANVWGLLPGELV